MYLPVQNVSLQLTNKSTGQSLTGVSDIEGNMIFTELVPGKYSLSIFGLSQGINAAFNPVEFIWVQPEEIVYYKNKITSEPTSIVGRLVDEKNQGVPGGIFQLTDESSNLTYTLTTDDNGFVVFENRLAGPYIIESMNYPAGYLPSHEPTISSFNKYDVAYGRAFKVVKDQTTNQSIQIYSLPHKLDYVKGESIDASGGQLEVLNGTQSTIINMTEEMFEGQDFTGIFDYGRQEVEIIYNNLSTYLDIWFNPFKDVKHTHWTYDYINQLVYYNAVTGFEDGTFKPNEQITRAQALVMLMKANRILTETHHDSVFSDVSNTNWAKDYIMTAYHYGYIKGLSDGSFGSNKPITRAELAKMVVNISGYKIPDVSTKSFIDIKPTHWAYEYIMTLAEEEVVNGYNDGTFGPNKNATRGEFAKIVYNSMKK